jgi:hypothetical protein
MCLFHGTGVPVDAALNMASDELTYAFLVEAAVSPVNLSAAGVGPTRLKRMGLSSAEELRALGFDPLYLTDPKFLAESVAEFGAHDIVGAYLTSASDAVAISGSDVVGALGIPPARLLEECAGAPQEAYAVLKQLPSGSLTGVPASVVLDTGLRKKALMELGYSLTAVASQTRAGAPDLRKLGY